jgi:L-iditol 2-dehydrogenase
VKASYLVKAHKFAVEEVPTPEPGPGEVLARVLACGICGSDMHFYEHGRIGDFVVEQPLVLGHEASAEVVECGPGVRALKPGDLVALEPGIPCERCPICLSGRYNLCPHVRFMSAPPDDGFFREYVAIPEEFAHKLPEGLDGEVGATVEPLAVGLHAIGLVGLNPADSVVVLGAGPIGLVCTAAARALGAADITTVDLLPYRLEFAGRMGASRCLNASDADPAELLRDSADVVLDCVAVDATFEQTFDIVKPGGRVAWVGMAGETAAVPFQKFQVKELMVTGVFRYANRFPVAVDLLASGRVDTRPLVTHRFAFPQVEEAIRFAVANKAQAIKTLVTFD